MVPLQDSVKDPLPLFLVREGPPTFTLKSIFTAKS